MESALRNTPAEKFKVPQGITLVKVDLETGLPANGDGKETVWEAFLDGNFLSLLKRRGRKRRGLPHGKRPGESCQRETLTAIERHE